MSRIEEMTTVRAGAAQAMALLRDHRRTAEWISPDLVFAPLSVSPLLTPGDRFRVSLLGGIGFEYLVEAITDRELVLAFWGPWTGRERWSFVADGAETIVRRTYEVTDLHGVPALLFDTAGRAVIGAHYKLELPRFRAALERDPGPRAEIQAGESSAERPVAGAESRSIPVDER
ncbi:MAG TPA: hypothetical protein VJ812_12635 [Gemmatimonadaceae bacterium]|jgi:hypothetical protein|nr:hypothetical protein [Gemmatimonadaceae bacterium]